MNYYIQQRFFIYYMAEEKILLHILVIVDVLVEIKSRVDAALGKTVFLR